MALLECPECNHSISTSAKFCPSCGYKEKKKGCFGVTLVILLFTFVLGYAAVRLTGKNPILDAIRGEGVAESRSYKKGYKSGFEIGSSDAKEGKERRGAWAATVGEAAGILEQDPQPKEYQKGFHRGYNEGWHSVR